MGSESCFKGWVCIEPYIEQTYGLQFIDNNTIVGNG